jgi:HNH endonuclease
MIMFCGVAWKSWFKQLFEIDLKGEDVFGVKKCTQCLADYPATEEYFYKQKVTTKKKGTLFKLQAACIICRRKQSRERGNANKEQRRKNRRKWYLANKDHDNAKSRAWQRNNPERKKENDQRYRQSEIGKQKFRESAERRKEINHNITNNEWNACKEYFDHTCAYCGMSYDEHKQSIGKDLHKEHVIADGRNDLKNCVPSCWRCNSSKWRYSLNNWYNENNPNYTYERYKFIYNWIRYDCKKYIEHKNK